MENKSQNPRIKWVNPTSLVVPETRIWSNLTPEQEKWLLEDIREHGVKQPIKVKAVDKMLIVEDGGHRAVMAAQSGIKKVPIWVSEGDEEDLALQNVVLSMLQGRIKTADVVNQFRHMIEELNMNPEDIEKASPFTAAYTRKLLSIAEGSPYLLEFLDKGELTVQAAGELARIPDPTEQYQVADECIRAKWGFPDIKDVVAQRLEEQNKPVEERKPVEETKPRGVPCYLCGATTPAGELTTLLLCPACYGVITQAKQAEQAMSEEAETSTTTSLPGPTEPSNALDSWIWN